MSSFKKISLTVLVILILGGGLFYANRTLAPESGDVSDLQARMEAILAPPTSADFYEDSNRLEVNKGTVTVKRTDGTREEVAKETTVSAGDTIIVNADSQATLYWFDDSVSRLQAGTELTIDKADYNPEDISETHVNLNVVKGEVWSKVVNLVDKDSEFLTYSGPVVAGVRGSVYDFLVQGDTVEAESVEHSAFIGERDPKTREIINTGVIPAGKQARAKKKAAAVMEAMEMSDLGQSDLDRQWFKDNQQKDEQDAVKIKEKNLKRIRDLAGPLPGDPDYDLKNRWLQDKLQSLTDPKEKAALEARIAALRTREAIALAGTGETPDFHPNEDMKTLLGTVEDPTVREDIGNHMRLEMKLLDRSMDGVLADQKPLYDLRQDLRDAQVDLESDPDARTKLQEKFSERRLYELTDLEKLKNPVPPEVIKEQFDAYQRQMQQFKDTLKNNPEMLQINEAMFKKLEGLPVNKDELARLQKELQPMIRDLQKQPLPTTPPVIKKILTRPVLTPKPLPVEVQDEIKRLAPFRGGPSNV